MCAVRVGIVGLGHNGQAWVQGYHDFPGAEVVAVCDFSEAKIAQARERAPEAVGYTCLDEMLTGAGLDAVSIHTPDHLHADPFVKALQAGCHVMVEKPMGNTMEDLERMTAAARATDRKVHVGQVLRFNPFFARVKQLCADGELGQITYMEGDYIHNLLCQADPARLNPDIGGINWYLEHEKPIVGGGVHPLDLLRWFADSEIVETAGFGNSIAFGAMRYNDCQAALFWFESGAVAKVSALYAPVGPMPQFYNLAVYGTRGTIRDGHLFVGEGHEAEATDLSHLGISGHPYDPQVEHFVDCIVNDKPTLVDAFDGANSAAATVMADEAIRAGQRLAVPNFRGDHGGRRTAEDGGGQTAR